MACERRSRACLAEPPARVALDDKNLGTVGGAIGAVGEFSRQTEFSHRGLARNILFLAAAQPLLGALDHEFEQLVGLRRIAGEPMVERVLDRLLDNALRFGGGEAILGLALEFRLADEHREHGAGADHDVVRGDGGGALALADALGVILQPAQQRATQAGFVGAAVGRRDGVAIGIEKRVGVGGPGHGPLRGAVGAGLAGGAGEDVGMDQRRILERLAEIILQPFLEVERRLFRHVVYAAQQLLGAGPADFDAAEQISLGARHLEHALGLERGLWPKNLRVGMEAHAGAALVRGTAELLQLAFRLAALERHVVMLLLAPDIDLHAVGQRVGHRDADAVQAARSLVDFRSRICRRRAACT